MKIKVSTIVSIILLSLLVITTASAQRTVPPGSGWNTGIQIQNVGDGVANIVLTGYDATGTATYTDSTTGANTPAGASVNYTTFPSGASQFMGAAVVSADQPIVAIVNVNNGASGGFAAGQYQGTAGTNVDTTVLFPLVKNRLGPKCTLHYVQNAGDAAAKIYAKFSNESTWDSGANVDPGDMVVIDPAVATPAVPGDKPYALTVTSTQKLAGTVLEFACDETSATILQATRGFAPADGATTLLSPIYKYQFGSRTNGLQVQNVSSGPADVYVTFSRSGETVVHHQKGVPSGASVTFFKNTILCTGCGTSGKTGDLSTGALYAATITATANIVAINNESFDPVPPTAARNTATTFSAIPLSQAGTKIGIPLAKEEFANKTTGIQIQNAGDTQSNVKVTYVLNKPDGAACLGTYVLQNILIDPGKSVTLYRTNTGSIPSGSSWVGGNAIKTGCFGGATIEVVSGGEVVAVVQEPDINPNAAARQDTKNYEGFKIQ